jgi:hypothetical protein
MRKAEILLPSRKTRSTAVENLGRQQQFPSGETSEVEIKAQAMHAKCALACLASRSAFQHHDT